MLEKRTSSLESEGNRLVGYAAVYSPAMSEDLGGFKERIHPGAFDASLEKNADIRALWDHNTSQPLARTTNNTLRLSSDKRGLRVEIELPEGVSYADDLRQLVRSGVVNQMSFGFMVPPGGDAWDKDEDGNAVRTLHQVDLHEVSVVSIPAYPDTTVALRGLRQMDFEQRRARWLAEHGYRAAKHLLFTEKEQLPMNKIDEIKKLTEERAALVEQIRALTPEEQAQMDALTQAVADLDARLMAVEDAVSASPDEAQLAEDNGKPAEAQRKLDEVGARCAALLERLEKTTTRRSQPMQLETPYIVKDLNDRQANKDRDMALRGWLLGNEATDAHKSAAQRAGLDLRSASLRINRNEVRAQSTTNSSGGFTIPQGFLAELEKKLAFYNPLRSVARVITTDSGNALPIPTVDDTTNTGAIGSENSAPSATDITFSSVTLNAYRYESLVLCSNELLQDSGVDLASEIGSILGERIGRSEAAAFTTGTGSSQPQGCVTGSSAGATSASATAIALSDIVNLIASLDFAYQQSASFMMHQSVWYAVLRLVDSQGRPLVADVINGNQPRLYGFPVVVNNNMASSIATTNKTILFGDFSKYLIRDASALEVRRLDERYADQYATGFLAVGRRDGKVLQSAAIKRLTQA